MVPLDSKLNAGAAPFNPALSEAHQTISDTSSASGHTTNSFLPKQPNTKLLEVKPPALGISSLGTTSLVNVSSGSSSTSISLQKMNPTQESLSRFSKNSATISKSSSSNQINVTEVTLETDEEASEVQLEQESVWANAEALVEAELRAEERAWDALLAHDSVETGVPSPNGMTSTVIISAASTPLTPTRRISVDTELDEGSAYQSSPISSTTSSEKRSSPHRRSLHDKLSSPDRKKISQLSPEQMMQLQLAKHSAAEINRDQTMAERRMKAGIVSSRVKAVEEMKARKKETAEKLLENRLEGAEKRHEDYINSIRGKAGNENKKVNEVIFINTLNEAALSEQLQKQLLEVEERIKACRQRRQNRLDDISHSNKHKVYSISRMYIAKHSTDFDCYCALHRTQRRRSKCHHFA